LRSRDSIKPWWKSVVIAPRIAPSLEEFAAAAFAEVKLDWRDHVDIDQSLMRPSDIACSLGDASKVARMLDWRPRVGFSEIVSRMVRAQQ
jgi:GDPmannose 4,6-dehydratase